MTDINVSKGNTSIEVTKDDITFTITQAVAVAVTYPYVDADTLLSLEGSGGDTGFKYNSTSGKIEVYINNTKVGEFGPAGGASPF